MRKSDKRGADVAVVGAGVAGLAAARELARRGLGVVVVESARPGAGASEAAAGMLAPQAEADRADELFRLLCASREMYPAFADALREESGIDIELDRTGTLFVALTETDEREVERRFAWQTRAGLEVERLGSEEARALEPQVSAGVRVALRFPRDWQVENRRLVRSLAASVEGYGARMLSETEACGVRVVAGRVEGVETTKGFVKAGSVVLAAGSRTSRIPLVVSEREGAAAREEFASHPLVEPVRGQMLCLRQTPSSAPFTRHVIYSPRGYLVPRRDGRLLAGATSEHAVFDSEVTAGGVHKITSSAFEIAPAVASLALVDSWAGLRPRAEDGLPVIGESADVEGLFYATGYFRNGILLAPATGEIVADLVNGGATKPQDFSLTTFSPARFRRALAGSFGD